MKKTLGLVGLVLLLLVVGVGALIYYAPIYIAKEAVRAGLNDPDSAQFRNMRKTSRTSVCGEVNAKNRMGGYVGYTPFYVLIMGHDFKTDADIISRGSFAELTSVTVAQDPSMVFGFRKELAALDTNFVKEQCGKGADK